MKMVAGGPRHRPAAASAERAAHATGRMLAGLGHLRAGLATEAVRCGTQEPGQRADGGCSSAAVGPGAPAGPDGDPDRAGPGDRPGPAICTELNGWAGSAAIAVNPDFQRLSLAKAIGAMIHAMTASEAVASAVIDQLRQSQD